LPSPRSAVFMVATRDAHLERIPRDVCDARLEHMNSSAGEVLPAGVGLFSVVHETTGVFPTLQPALHAISRSGAEWSLREAQSVGNTPLLARSQQRPVVAPALGTLRAARNRAGIAIGGQADLLPPTSDTAAGPAARPAALPTTAASVPTPTIPTAAPKETGQRVFATQIAPRVALFNLSRELWKHSLGGSRVAINASRTILTACFV
jgi:hypothetical protein